MKIRAILQSVRDRFPTRSKGRVVCWLPLALGFCLVGCNEKKKDLSPPPLNPHPKEAVHIRVSFDNPEDAKHYTVTMDALYQNQQRECGYIASWWVGNFVYPRGQFDIPNESRESEYGDFTIYLDRYNRETCNWEFGMLGVKITNNSTGWYASTGWGDEEVAPGMEHKETCTFVGSDPNMCWREDQLTPERMRNVLVPITLRVSEDSVLPRPHQSGFFSNFLQPMNPAGASATSPQNYSK
jgi:hypothetical protein